MIISRSKNWGITKPLPDHECGEFGLTLPNLGLQGSLQYCKVGQVSLPRVYELFGGCFFAYIIANEVLSKPKPLRKMGGLGGLRKSVKAGGTPKTRLADGKISLQANYPL